ncbi:hypothetical protein SteCoe_30823 [Stentor coeruleus]|uniref:Uncharacterized protein n=1 Tax=Stentor coeruleus TaxID=5963 RepID=A0A1R2B2U3_9CILI|nr:hypothetical protein SteCoe_30823 [Stentor coeruleus]
MFDFLIKNIEIQEFLENFPQHQRDKAIEAASLLGIRKFISHKMPFTISTLNSILSSSTNINKALNSMKLELKELNTAIKRIEKTALISSEVLKENEVKLDFEGKGRVKDTVSKRSSKSKRLKKVFSSTEIRPGTPGFSFSKDLHEPKVCPLNDAKRLIRYLNPCRESVSKMAETGRMPMDFLKTRSSLSTQGTL